MAPDLSRLHIFQELDAAALEEVSQAARHRHVASGEVFFHQDDPAVELYALEAGQVKVFQISLDGERVTLQLLNPGTVFGGLAALGSQIRYPVSAEAVEDCDVLAWDGREMGALMQAHPRIALNLMELLVNHVVELQDRYRELATEQVEQRLARALLRLVRQAGRKAEAGVRIDLPLTRQTLAELTGTTLFTVSRIMSRWHERGLIESGKGQVTICRPHDMVELAEDLPTVED